jgi:hypothetical protein
MQFDIAINRVLPKQMYNLEEWVAEKLLQEIMIGEYYVNFPDGSPKQRSVPVTLQEENLCKPFTLLFGLFFLSLETNQESDSQNCGNSKKRGTDIIHV